ncbi:transglutaminase-like domain-containing protein [Clostridium sp.]|uniref:transglutaminase-like domain-containing protein n=1 Tax=Clostridium sp. TaxID=1506 RepID=UPI00261F9F68|nr:transglutaminase-like domain-containing protein [Clostridium sp.]
MIIIIEDALEEKAFEIGQSLKNEIDNSLVISKNNLENLIKSIFIDEDSIKHQEVKEFENNTLIYLIRNIKEKFGKNLIISLEKNTESSKEIKNRIKKLDEEFYFFKTEESLYIKLNIVKEEKNFIIHKDTIEEMKTRILEVLKISKKSFIERELVSNKIYLIKGNNLDINLLNSSHQSIKNLYKKKGFCEITLEVHPLIIQQELIINNLDIYTNLEDLSKEDMNLLKDINKNINNNEREVTKIIENTLNYIRTFKKERENYNNKDVIKNLKTISETINYKKGNIFELTKLFMSIIRYCEIPTKLIFGIINKSSYHSWIEVYSEEIGWIPVETKINIKMKNEKYYFGITNKHIKLFEDVNFENINEKLKKIEIEVIPNNQTEN